MNGARRGAAARPSKAGAERRCPAAAWPNREPPADVVGGKAWSCPEAPHGQS